MFQADADAPLAEDTELLKMKIRFKVAEGYSKLGEVPGVLVDKVRRQKILKDLGHVPQSTVTQPESAQGVAEETKEESKAA